MSGVGFLNILEYSLPELFIVIVKTRPTFAQLSANRGIFRKVLKLSRIKVRFLLSKASYTNISEFDYCCAKPC